MTLKEILNYWKKAVIELDGPIHETTFEYDEFRDFEMDFFPHLYEVERGKS